MTNKVFTIIDFISTDILNGNSESKDIKNCKPKEKNKKKDAVFLRHPFLRSKD
jgi:hypothetical protein